MALDTASASLVPSSKRPDRDQILICTKGGNNMVTGVRNFTPDYIRGCVEGSLQRLGIAAIDLYLLHNPTLENMQARDSVDVLETYKTQGKIKHWGVSVNTLPECDYVVASGVPSVMQMEYITFSTRVRQTCLPERMLLASA